MNTVFVWILVAVSSAGSGREGFAVPAFSPAVATAEDCQKLLQATQRVVRQSDGRRSAPAMECISVRVLAPGPAVSAAPKK